MKKLIMLLACLFAFTAATTLQAQDKKKEKKEKERKEYVWEMPKLTGNADFDKYLLKCDTVYNRIKTYSDSIDAYHVVLDYDIDAQGDTIFIPKVVDDQGRARGTSLAAMQYFQYFTTGTSLLADIVSITALTATATTALPSLGVMKAVSYGKYVKAGPKIVQMGTREINDILSDVKKQRKMIRNIRNYYKTLEDKENPNAQIDANKIIAENFKDVLREMRTPEQREADKAQEAQDNALAQQAGYDPDSEAELDV